jgi:predicted nucleic acid-binding protein
MICVDASVAVKWVLDEELTDLARTLYDATLERDEVIVAPPLLRFEVTNIVRQRLRRQRDLTLSEASRVLAEFLLLPIAFRSSSELHLLALGIAAAYDLPAASDAHYLALAQQLGCDFWTDDRRLLRQVGHNLPFVRWLGDFGAVAES